MNCSAFESLRVVMLCHVTNVKMPAGCKLVTIPSFVEVMHPFDNVNERSNMLGNSAREQSRRSQLCRHKTRWRHQRCKDPIGDQYLVCPGAKVSQHVVKFIKSL